MAEGKRGATRRRVAAKRSGDTVARRRRDRRRKNAALHEGAGNSDRSLPVVLLEETCGRDPALASGSVVVSPHFADRLGRETFALPEGLTVAQIIAGLAAENTVPEHVRDYLVVQLDNGKYVARTEWDTFVPPAGRTMMIYVTPAGGSRAGQVIGLVLMVAIAIFAGPVAGLIAPTLVGTVEGFALTAGIQLVGSLAVGALFKPASTGKPGGDNSPINYTLTNQSNQVTPYGTIPRNFGSNRMAPRLVAQARHVLRGQVQYIQAVYSFGYGPQDITDIRSGNTPIGSIPGLRHQIYESFVAGNALNIYTNDTQVSNVGAVLDFNVPVTSSTPVLTPSAYIDIVFPGGIVDVNPQDGSYRNWHTIHYIYIRDVTAAGAFVGISGVDPNYGVDGGLGWQAIGRGSDYVEWVSNTTKTLLGTVSVRFPHPSQWEIRVTRGTADVGTNVTQAAQWTTLQSLNSAPPIAPRKPETIIEIEVPASEQVNNTLQLLTAVATSRLRAWDGNAFIAPQDTRNPAWIYLEMLTGAANPRPILDARLDLDWFLAFANYCNRAAPGSGEVYATCDVVIEQQTTLWEAIQIPLGCGRASYAKIGGKHAGIMEELTRLPVQVFTELNSTGLSANRTYLDEPHALRTKFIDPDSNWELREIIVYADGFTAANATKFEDLTLPGITRATQAWRDGRYFWASAKMRREMVQITTDIENLACDRGSLVYVAHDVLQAGGAPGYITEVVDANSLRLGGVDFTALNPAGLSVRIRQPGSVGPIIGIVSFTGTDVVNLAANHNSQVGDLVVWGDTTTIVGEYIVADIARQEELKAQLTLLEWAPNVLLADQGAIPPYTPQHGGRPTASLVLPVRSLTALVSRVITDGVKYAQIILTWRPSETVGIVRYDVFEEIDSVWVGLGSVTTDEYVDYPLILLSSLSASITKTFRVRAIASNGDFADDTIGVLIDPFRIAETVPNLLRNSDFTEDIITDTGDVLYPDARALRSWGSFNSGMTPGIGRNREDGKQWNIGLGGAWMYDGAPIAAAFFGISQNCPATAGSVYEAHVKVALIKCKGQLGLQFLNAALTPLQTIGMAVDAGAGQLNAVSTDLSTFQFLWVQGVAPANTAWVQIQLFKFSTNAGQADSYAFWHRAMVNVSSADRTIANPTPWNDTSSYTLRGVGYTFGSQANGTGGWSLFFGANDSYSFGTVTSVVLNLQAGDTILVDVDFRGTRGYALDPCYTNIASDIVIVGSGDLPFVIGGAGGFHSGNVISGQSVVWASTSATDGISLMHQRQYTALTNQVVTVHAGGGAGLGDFFGGTGQIRLRTTRQRI